jgi:uncharacterized membrane protein YccC
VRSLFAGSSGRVVPVYGVVMAVGIGAPLIVGMITGHTAECQLVALGAYYVGVGAPQGPYGAQLRSMLTAVAVVTVCTWLGGAMSGHPWPAVVVVSLVAALGVAIPWVGPIASLCTLVAALRPETSPALFNGFLETIGGLWVSVLLLAPWITHRLRPLRTSLAGGAASVAEALEAAALEVADPHTWYDRRKEAYATLRSARATYGLYRGGGRDEHERLQRLIDTMQRTMDQTVALRSLLIEAGRGSVPGAWLGECRIAIGALAARMRGLASAIEEGGGAVPESTVQLDRLTRMTEDVRREWVAGRTDVVAAALVQQMRRTVRRIAATTDGLAETVSLGLDLGVLAPRLSGSYWTRLKESVGSRSPGFRHAARVGVAIAVSTSIAFALKLPHPHWLSIPVLFTLRDSYGDTVSMVLQRIGGTVLGATAAAIALTVAPGPPTLVGLILFGAVVGFTLKPSYPAYWIVFSTPMIMLLIDFTAQLSWKDALWRIGLTFAGGGLAVAASRLLWPAGTSRRLPTLVTGMLAAHADFARTVAARMEGERDASVRERAASAAQAAGLVESAATRLAQEPAPPESAVRDLTATVTAAERVRDHLRTLGAFTEDEPRDVGPIPAVLERVADHLEHDEAAPLDLDDLLEELDDHLASLTTRRRAELGGGVGTDASTHLRRSLVDVAGARYAVRALRFEAENLRTSAGDALR